MPFPNQLSVNPAIGVAGDYADANPRASFYAGNGALVAGPNGVTVGAFAWVDDQDDTVSSSGVGPVSGFVHREQQALITAFLGETSMTIPKGLNLSIATAGDFLVVNGGTNVVTRGMKAYANFKTGLVTFAATGSPPAGASGSASSVAAGAASVTASIAIVPSQTGPDTGVMTVTAVGSGALVPGASLSGSGVQSGTSVDSQLSGTKGGIGTYLVNIPQTTASTTITAAYGILTVGGTVVAGFAVGDVLTGSGVDAGTTILSLGTGTGGAGTYNVSSATVVSSTAIAGSAGVETKWFAAKSGGQPGDLVPITSWPLG